MSTWGPYRGRVIDWHDGDTCHMDVDVGFGFQLQGYYLDGRVAWRCRVFGINAPELTVNGVSNPAGIAARDHASSICPPGTLVTVISHGWDREGGRFDGEIHLTNGDSFGDLMIAAGQAVVYP